MGAHEGRPHLNECGDAKRRRSDYGRATSRDARALPESAYAARAVISAARSRRPSLLASCASVCASARRSAMTWWRDSPQASTTDRSRAADDLPAHSAAASRSRAASTGSRWTRRPPTSRTSGRCSDAISEPECRAAAPSTSESLPIVVTSWPHVGHAARSSSWSPLRDLYEGRREQHVWGLRRSLGVGMVKRLAELLLRHG